MAALRKPLEEMQFILATDVGSTTTKARFFHKKDGEWRFLVAGEAPTTVEAPYEDVTMGVQNAVREIEELTNHKILATDGQGIVLPYDGKIGVDLYCTTSSAGGGLQMMVGGLIKSMTAESANRAALGAGAIVMDVKKNSDAVEICTHTGDRFQGTFCIAADGINSLIARKLGMNRNRHFFATASAISFYVTGVEFDRSEMICMGNSYDHEGNLGMVHLSMLPSVYRDDEYWLYTADQEKFDFLTLRSVFSPWFKNVEIQHKRCSVINMWSSARDPFKDNVLFVGDSVWFGEAENNGALLSGHKAANAVCKALHIGQPNGDGVKDYRKWWEHNFYNTHDYRDFLCYPVFFRLFSEDELIYLHKLVKKKLVWTLNPFNLYNHIQEGLAPHMEQIKNEKPVLAKKIAGFTRETAMTLIKPLKRFGFPAYF